MLSFFGWSSLLFAQSYDVEWTDLVGAVADGNLLTKTASTNWQNCGAASTNVLTAGSDGWMEIEIDETNTHRVVGLSEDNKDHTRATIEYAFLLISNGNLRIYEDGNSQGSVGGYTEGDRLMIERVNGTVLYKKNDVLLRTSDKISDSQLVVDVTLYHENATLNNVTLSFASNSSVDTTDTGVVVVDTTDTGVELE